MNTYIKNTKHKYKRGAKIIQIILECKISNCNVIKKQSIEFSKDFVGDPTLLIAILTKFGNYN